MNVVVFLGPSLRIDRAREILPGAQLLPPAACGDVYRACERGATVIGLVDGYFDHQLSVWHKELLWALCQGVRVYGAASIGALRAAELRPFGMRGIGKIADLYARGVLEDDDEVAVIHEPRERGYQSRSDAMVNIRATLEAAVKGQVLTSGAAQALLSAGKSRFYPERSYARLLEEGVTLGIDATEMQKFRIWMASAGPVNQKELDTLELLQVLSQLPDQRVPSLAPSQFPHTNAWRRFREALDAELHPAALPSNATLRDTSPDARICALERALALLLAQADGAEPSAAAVQEESERFRRARGLLTPEATNQWLESNGLDLEAFSRFMHENVHAASHLDVARELAARCLTDVQRLRSSGGPKAVKPLAQLAWIAP